MNHPAQSRSGLTALLAGDEQPGVWRWTSHQPADDVRRVANSAGWRFGAVDGWTLTGRDQVLGAIGEELAFPDHYGRNLDALADCLAELPDDTVLLWDGWAVLFEEDVAGFLGVLAVLTDLSEASGRPRATAGGMRPRLAVLLRGDGPELPDVQSLD